MILLIMVISCGRSNGYSVLTHEEIVDLLWTAAIRPLLLKRYPGLSEDQIREAHAYAYGGAVIQDLGYYPFGGGSSVTWCITCAAAISCANFCSKAGM
jgi:hypothetical protein